MIIYVNPLTTPSAIFAEVPSQITLEFLSEIIQVISSKFSPRSNTGIITEVSFGIPVFLLGFLKCIPPECWNNAWRYSLKIFGETRGATLKGISEWIFGGIIERIIGDWPPGETPEQIRILGGISAASKYLNKCCNLAELLGKCLIDYLEIYFKHSMQIILECS